MERPRVRSIVRRSLGSVPPVALAAALALLMGCPPPGGGTQGNPGGTKRDASGGFFFDDDAGVDPGGGEDMSAAATDAGSDPLCTDVAQCPGKVSIAHCWGITNPAPALYTTTYALPTHNHCAWGAVKTCRAIAEAGVRGDGPAGPCCSRTGNGVNCNGPFNGMWHEWIGQWWKDGWLPSLGLSRNDVRKGYVVYNRNAFLGGPHHNEDCDAIRQLQSAIVDAYRNCDTHFIVTTHSNGGVTFLWAWRSFIEDALGGPAAAAFDADRATTCRAKGRLLPGGDAPPLFVNGHLMQAAVGDGSNIGESPSDFFPIQPYETVGKTYWEPRDGAGRLRAMLGVRFYYNHEDVMTYDFTGISTVGRNEVLGWLDGTSDKKPVGAQFWLARAGQPPYVALHACGHTSSHSSSMGASNDICGDLIIRNVVGFVTLDQACARECGTVQDWYDSAQGPGFCLNPCHHSCWGLTALTAISIRDPAVFPAKFPFSFGNSNLLAMGQSLGLKGWLDNRMRLDWRELYDRQVVWCHQDNVNEEQEKYTLGSWPAYGPLTGGRNDGSGEVQF